MIVSRARSGSGGHALCLLVALLALAVPRLAEACSCRPQSAQQAAPRVHAIVEGRVVYAAPSPDGAVEQAIRVRVDAVYKGGADEAPGDTLDVIWGQCNDVALTTATAARIWFLTRWEGRYSTSLCEAALAANDEGRAIAREVVLLAEGLGQARDDTTVDPETADFTLTAMAIGWRLHTLEAAKRMAGPDRAPTPELLRVHALIAARFAVRMAPPADHPAAALPLERASFSYVADRVSLYSRGGGLLSTGLSLARWWADRDAVPAPPRPRPEGMTDRHWEYYQSAEARNEPPAWDLGRWHVSIGHAARVDRKVVAALLEPLAPQRGDPAAVAPLLRSVCALVSGAGCASAELDASLLAP
ncbi:MAG: hypothetical protein EXR71_19275 [Myxococcales bacterium]|nr:hypothetical protein [Myxococcales bacterium]